MAAGLYAVAVSWRCAALKKAGKAGEGASVAGAAARHSTRAPARRPALSARSSSVRKLPQRLAQQLPSCPRRSQSSSGRQGCCSAAASPGPRPASCRAQALHPARGRDATSGNQCPQAVHQSAQGPCRGTRARRPAAATHLLSRRASAKSAAPRPPAPPPPRRAGAPSRPRAVRFQRPAGGGTACSVAYG